MKIAQFSLPCAALKTVPGAAEGGVPVAVFDELDSGVGGRIGARVGSSLRRLASSGHQVSCLFPETQPVGLPVRPRCHLAQGFNLAALLSILSQSLVWPHNYLAQGSSERLAFWYSMTVLPVWPEDYERGCSVASSQQDVFTAVVGRLRTSSPFLPSDCYPLCLINTRGLWLCASAAVRACRSVAGSGMN